MKKSLLATVAAVALIAGAGIASAAEGAKDQPKAGQSEMKGDAAGMKGDAAKKAEPEMKKGAAIKSHETTGAGNESHVDGPRGPAPDSNDDKRDTGPRGDNATKGKPTTVGETEHKAMEPGAKSVTEEKSGSSSMSKSSASEKAGEKSNSSAQSTTSAQGGAKSLTAEQKTKIRTSVLQSGPKVSRSSINFNIRVGTAVPRSVHFVTVPQTIVEYYPEWRGFNYFVVDEEIIILDPHTLQIVAVINV
jgi:hypothetical protein